MQAYGELIGSLAEAEVAVVAGRRARSRSARARSALTLDVIMRAVFGSRDERLRDGRSASILGRDGQPVADAG